MDIDKFLKDFLRQEEKLKELTDFSNPLRRILEEEGERQRKLLEPLSKTARQLEESHRSIAESLQRTWGGTNCISEVLSRNENIWGELTTSTLAFDRLYTDSEIARDVFNKLTEQSVATRTAFNSIAESITQKYSLETHLRLPQIEAILSKDFLTSEDVETPSISSVPKLGDTYQDIHDFIEYTEKSSDEEISQYFSQLGRPVQLIILWILDKFIVAFVVGVLVANYHDSGHLQEIFDKSSLSSSREVNQVIRNLPSDIDLSDYSEYRVVIGDRLHLRESPGMKSIVIEQIPRGKLVKVLEKRRTWTKVEVDFQESEIPLIGWVSTRYITSLKR